MMEIGPDAPISIELPRVQAGSAMTGLDGQIEISVEVSNNSDVDLAVERVLVFKSGGTSAYTMDQMNWSGHELIEEGESHVFHLKGWGKQTRLLERGEPGGVIVRVQVGLANGDTYYELVELPVLRGTM
jgi:hypothetical protein